MQGEQDVDTDEVAQAVLDVVRSTSCGACLVWAKADAVIVSLKERFPEQRAGYIVMNDTAAARAAGLHLPNRMPHVEALGVHYAMVDPVLVADAQSRGKQVLAWTANTVGGLGGAQGGVARPGWRLHLRAGQLAGTSAGHQLEGWPGLPGRQAVTGAACSRKAAAVAAAWPSSQAPQAVASLPARCVPCTACHLPLTCCCLLLLCWAQASMMRSVLDAGVDAIVTNHPRKLQAAIQSRLRKCEEQRRR